MMKKTFLLWIEKCGSNLFAIKGSQGGHLNQEFYPRNLGLTPARVNHRKKIPNKTCL